MDSLTPQKGRWQVDGLGYRSGKVAAGGSGSFAFAQDNSNGALTSGTTLATTLTSVAADDLIAICTTWIHATGTASVSDGTNTADAATEENGAFNQNMQWHYLLPGEHVTGSVTLTATFSSASTHRSIFAFRITTTGTVALDQQNADFGNGTSAASGNITTTGATSIAFGGVLQAGYSVGPTDMQINGVAGTVNTVGPEINTIQTWFRIVSSTFTGQATATVDADGWICSIINFKAS